MGEKFTPGPWEVENSSVVTTRQDLPLNRVVGYGMNDGFICILDDGEYHSYMDETECQANAALIAAAPEMYEALKGLIDIFPKLNIEVDKTVLDRTPVWRKLCHILCSADEALKKARGEE